MLQASKANVVTKFHLEALHIRQAELQYFLLVFSRMQDIASFLGFSASAALSVDFDTHYEKAVELAKESGHAIHHSETTQDYLKAFFLFVATTCFGSFFTVLMISTLCSMWGPGKALRGDNAAAMDYAVMVLSNAHEIAIKFTFLGIISFMFAAILLVWLLFPWKGSVPATVVLMFFAGKLSEKSFHIYEHLFGRPYASSPASGERELAAGAGYHPASYNETGRSPNKQFVSSALRGNLVKDVGELMGDKSLEGVTRAGISTKFANSV
ncbi:unnamed protein product [Amoebophrya sp. A120]|nr:unnamed protein product [Amoebophrya sp. A120]|eukprot:GSA120T00019480001.1